MGNTALSRDHSSRRFSPEEREAMKKFCDEEIHLLRETFKGLANGKNGDDVDKETFLKCFPLPGLLGERLFEVIDKDGSGTIGYNEFMYGLAILFRGTQKEKLKFIFDLYDLSESGSISRHELVTMLHQFPESALDLLKHTRDDPATGGSPRTQNNTIDEIDALVNLAFPHGQTTNRLTFEQFTEWCERTPGIANFLMSVLPTEESSAAAVAPVDTHAIQRAEPPARRNSLKTLGPSRSSGRLSVTAAATRELEKTKQHLLEAKQSCPIDAVAVKIQQLIQELDSAMLGTGAMPMLPTCHAPRASLKLGDLNTLADEAMSGDLWKRGSRLRQMIKRHYVLMGNFLYYYANKDDAAPRGVTFLCGCYIESLPQQPVIEKNVKFYPIDIVPEPGSSREKRTIYAKSPEELTMWTTALRLATDKVSIFEFYEIGRELGSGKFSRVCVGTHKQSGARHAVKIIDKSKLVSLERELLRTEIAILKLVTHPNIIHLHDVYEDKQNIYIVTELVSGGDLFSRIDGQPRQTETQARSMMLPLLESVAYLHRLGIVHRDIKPENILCGENPSDLKIADFGLSKLVYPDEIMKMPCGTLNYVAPEVLKQAGYGREADIWSLGVIMYLLIRGSLPFQSKTKNEIIQKTLHAEINFETDPLLNGISPSCKSLLKGLLSKDPAHRLTATDALKHEWFTMRLSRPDSYPGNIPGLAITPRNSITAALGPTTIM